MKISVIIPVYNVEKYLRQCMDSVINQTYKNLEIICVNDASTDSSADILEEYASKDGRIIIINNEINSKLGPTRNYGMEYATGEYVHFLDSDDWLELDAYEKLVNYIKEAGEVDIVHFLWRNKYMITGNIVPCEYKDLSIIRRVANIYNTPELAVNWYRSAWCKLYRRKFLLDKNIEFNAYPCLEDIEHSVHVLTEAESVYLVPDLLLNYRANNPESLMRTCHKFYDCALKSYYTNVEYCKKLDDKTEIVILDKELYCLLSILHGSFVKGVIDLNAVRKIIEELDLSIFKENIQSYSWFIYYNDLMNSQASIIKLKHFLRGFTKSYTPWVHKILVNLRRKYVFFRRL